MAKKEKPEFTAAQERLLLEAARRYLKFHAGKNLRHAWVGLGTPSVYRCMVDAGLMTTHDGMMTPRINHWWVLTEKGADAVQKMINSFALQHVERRMGLNPNSILNQYELVPTNR